MQRAFQQAAAAERSVHLEQKSASALGAYSVPKKGGWCGMLMKKARSSVCNGILGGWDSPLLSLPLDAHAARTRGLSTHGVTASDSGIWCAASSIVDSAFIIENTAEVAYFEIYYRNATR